MVQFFSRKKYPYDSAGIEEFHTTLKKEEVYKFSYVTFVQFRMTLFQYMENRYRKRMYGVINNLTSKKCEQFVRQSP